MTIKATRHSKTPAQRAQEAVDVLTRRLAKLRDQQRALSTQLAGMTPQVESVQARLTYALASPDLPQKLAPGQRVPVPSPA